MNQLRSNYPEDKRSLGKNQLITLEDLADFKEELLRDLKLIVKNVNGKPSKQWLKSHEVRKILGISPGKLQALRDNGTIPFTRIGNVIFYSTEDIKAMMENFRQNSI